MIWFFRLGKPPLSSSTAGFRSFLNFWGGGGGTSSGVGPVLEADDYIIRFRRRRR